MASYNTFLMYLSQSMSSAFAISFSIFHFRLSLAHFVVLFSFFFFSIYYSRGMHFACHNWTLIEQTWFLMCIEAKMQHFNCFLIPCLNVGGIFYIHLAISNISHILFILIDWLVLASISVFFFFFFSVSLVRWSDLTLFLARSLTWLCCFRQVVT